MSAARGDIASGVALSVLAVAYYLGTRALPPGVDEPGPGLFPRMLALALLLLGGAIAASGLRNQETTHDVEVADGCSSRPALLALVTLLAVAVLPAIGFAPSAFLYALTTSRLFGGSVAASVGIAATATLAVYALFGYGLSVSLP